jgi:hypothetical protein
MAITIRKVTGENAQRYFPAWGERGLDLTDYLEALRGLAFGDIAEVEPGNVTARATKRRLTMAARQLGMTLQWSRQLMGGRSIAFRVRRVSEMGATPMRRGRQPKSIR